ASCQVRVDVTTSATPTIGACPQVANTNGAASISALANLTNGVTDQCVTVNGTAPTVAKAFAPSSIAVNGVSTLTITLSNANAAAATITSVTDNFPGAVVRAAAPNTATSCAGGAVSSTASSVTLTGGTIPAAGSCTFQIDVTSATAGAYVNT